MARVAVPLAAVLVLASAFPALPQAATASVEVAVTDRSGRPLPDVAVAVTTAGDVRRLATDARGTAVAFHLRPGRYVVAASAPGRSFAETPLEARAGRRYRVRLVAGEGEEGQRPEPVVEERFDAGASFSDRDRRGLPRPADPWSLLRDVPGVVLDRVDVGGSETAQQSLVVSGGDGGAGATWTLDGVDVTDPAALGFTSVYPDMDAVGELQVRTSAVDVRVRTPGVQIGLVLRDPPDRFSGSAHARGASEALQADNLPAALRGRSLRRTRTDHVLDLGAEAGGRVKEGRLWLWGAVSQSAIAQDVFTGHADRLRTTSLLLKSRLRLGSGALSLLALRGEKLDLDRDTTGSAAPEARWKQSGPARLLAAEDERRLGAVSLLTRLSYLDAGFRLEPRGGSQADPFEDYRGTFRGSYLSFETKRPRLEAGLEASSRARWLGLDHDLTLGAGYRHSLVTTRQQWPGGGALGLERRTVFFRVFELTGFALPTRPAEARSVQDALGAYVQDEVRAGRATLTVGARLDRLSGRSLSSAVPASPVFPDLLPAARYPGAPTGIRWVDFLPRAGLAWDVDPGGRAVARIGYSAYGAALGAGDVTFDDPLAQISSLTYYWRDRNGDRVVQPGELDMVNGRLGASGLDPDHPASAFSPDRIDPHLRSPRTHEVALDFDRALGRSGRLGLHVSLRRTLHTLWRPLRNLTLADYTATGAVRGQLFGDDYAVVFFAPAAETKIVPGNGRLLANREGYRQDSAVVGATARGRLGSRLGWQAWGAWSEWRERFLDQTLAIQDPTPLDTEPLRDAGVLAARPGGLGRGDVFVSARWTAGASVEARLPARLEGALLLHARQGFPIPYFQVGDTGDPTGAAKNVLVAPALDRYRLPALVLLDARVSRSLALGRGTLTASVDAFNLLNAGTALQVTCDVELPSLGRPREIAKPRILRLGVEYRF